MRKLSDFEEKIRATAYELVWDRAGRLLPLFEDLDVNLQKSGLKVSFKTYVSLTIFCSIIGTFTVSIITCVIALGLGIPALPAFMFGIGGGLFTGAITTIVFYGYPIYRADAMKRQLEDELPFTTGYMAILTSAGISPETIFGSMSNLTVPLATSSQVKDIVRDVNLFGSDVISALQEASKRSPSQQYKEMIEGFISTIHSGGNLSAYLREKSLQYMRLKKLGLKKYSDTLSMLSEFYVAILLTGPLMLIIMLTVMAMLGGGGIGILGPDILLSLLTYIAIPVGAVVFLIILDASSPKW